MENNELQWDKLLKIKTTGRDNSHSDQYCYPYEPTPYSGTGKGRVCFYLSYQVRCHSIGVEYDERIYLAAEENKKHANSCEKVSFVNVNAETFMLPVNVDRCFFFNPFSIEILQKALARIYESYYDNPREILLFFYYPSDDYVGYLMTQEQLMFVDEVDCRDLFEGNNQRERILIFKVG